MRRSANAIAARRNAVWLSAAGSLLTLLLPFAPDAAWATALISASFFFALAGSVNIYALPIDIYGAEQSGIALAALTCAFGILQTVISPAIGWLEHAIGLCRAARDLPPPERRFAIEVEASCLLKLSTIRIDLREYAEACALGDQALALTRINGDRLQEARALSFSAMALENAGRYQEAYERRVSMLQLARAKETVAFDVAANYLQKLLTAAVRVVQDEAIRSAEATLKDTRARRAAGVADRDDVLRAEVQLSESRDALVVAQEAELAALARLNNVLGRNAGLPLELIDRKPRPEFSLTLVQCLETAAAQRR